MELTEEEQTAVNILHYSGTAILSGFLMNVNPEKTCIVWTLLNEKDPDRKKGLLIQLAAEYADTFIKDSQKASAKEFKEFLGKIVDDIESIK